MNNDNFNKFNYLSHDLINNIHKISQEVLNSTLDTSLPIINTLANTNLKNNEIKLINYYIESKNNKIKILCEIPGLSKDNCKVNYKDNIIRIMGKTDYKNQWDFIKNINYYREINIGFVNRNTIKVTYNNGCLSIEIDKITLDNDSNIEIN